MKKLGLFLILVVLGSSMVFAYSFDDFFGDIRDAFGKFFELTGFVVLDVVKDTSGSVTNGISIPEPPIVEATKEESVQEGVVEPTEPFLEEISGGDDKVTVPECSDFLDNNVNYFKKGVCKDIKGSFEDYCSNGGGSVLEYSCGSNDFCEGSWYICPNGCKDGACISEVKIEFKPDFKILSIDNFDGKLIVSVKNLGTKGAFFKTKLLRGTEETISNVDYYLDAGEVVDVELGEEYFGEYLIEVLSDEDSNIDNNKMSGSLVSEGEEIEEDITGGVIAENEKKVTGSIFRKFLDFILGVFS